MKKRVLALVGALVLLAARKSHGQAPFVSDDAEVTERGHWHFEYANQFAVLQKSAYPNLRQDTNNFIIQYGLLEHLEVNVDFPLIAIGNDSSSGTASAFGLGDVDFAAKWKLVSEKPGGWPAFTVNVAGEFPTGSTKNQLGSGFTDFVLNTITQKTFSETQFHLNAGIQFSGNTQTGVVGIRTPGRIYSAGLSAARDLSKRVRLGLDLNGAEIHAAGRVDKQLQLTAGGNYAITSNDTLDVAVYAGWFNAPRVGLTLGVSITP